MITGVIVGLLFRLLRKLCIYRDVENSHGVSGGCLVWAGDGLDATRLDNMLEQEFDAADFYVADGELVHLPINLQSR